MLFGPLVFRSRLSVTDGRISIEQAYTAREAAAVARRAGLRGVQARSTRPFRFVLGARGGIAAALGAARPRKRFDVAVVGGGPAGSCAAIALGRLGFSVVVLERDRFPRHKVCGEFLSPEAIDDLDALGAGGRVRSAGRDHRPRSVLLRRRRRPVELPLPRPALGLSRFLLDAMLADIASAEESRRASRTKGRGHLRGPGRGILGRRRVEKDRPIAARAVLAAWGRWSPLDLDLGRAFAARRHGRFFGWSRHDRGDSCSLAGRVHLYFFREATAAFPGWRTEP